LDYSRSSFSLEEELVPQEMEKELGADGSGDEEFLKKKFLHVLWDLIR